MEYTDVPNGAATDVISNGRNSARQSVVSSSSAISQGRRTNSVISAVVREQKETIGFWKAWLLPKVALYAFSFFCVKLAVYSVLFNLPSFLSATYDYTDQQSANVSTANDMGGLIGTILAGIISDYTYSKRSPTSFVGIFCTMLLFYWYTLAYENVSYAGVITIYFVYGFFI